MGKYYSWLRHETPAFQSVAKAGRWITWNWTVVKHELVSSHCIISSHAPYLDDASSHKPKRNLRSISTISRCFYVFLTLQFLLLPCADGQFPSHQQLQLCLRQTWCRKSHPSPLQSSLSCSYDWNESEDSWGASSNRGECRV